MPINTDIKKVLVIGSGPIVIGQAAEFDYAGVQACRALKEENIEVVLVNSNPATIMTDENIADKVYIEPLTLKSLIYIIEKEITELISMKQQTNIKNVLLKDKNIYLITSSDNFSSQNEFLDKVARLPR